jgi:hypothetical protein
LKQTRGTFLKTVTAVAAEIVIARHSAFPKDHRTCTSTLSTSPLLTSLMMLRVVVQESSENVFMSVANSEAYWNCCSLAS